MLLKKENKHWQKKPKSYLSCFVGSTPSPLHPNSKNLNNEDEKVSWLKASTTEKFYAHLQEEDTLFIKVTHKRRCMISRYMLVWHRSKWVGVPSGNLTRYMWDIFKRRRMHFLTVFTVFFLLITLFYVVYFWLWKAQKMKSSKKEGPPARSGGFLAVLIL